jgi:hypothetical protein
MGDEVTRNGKTLILGGFISVAFHKMLEESNHRG